jgi:hypothetical protein
MTIGGLGTAGPFSDVLFLPDLRVNLFSQKQAMRDGSRISLSPDAQNYVVTRQLMVPFQTLKIGLTGGETLKRRLNKVYESTTRVIVVVLCSQFK